MHGVTRRGDCVVVLIDCEGHVAMDEGKLILFVQKYEELYNFKNYNYNNAQRREYIWEEIGRLMKQPGEF
jgi:hypothetical protein